MNKLLLSFLFIFIALTNQSIQGKTYFVATDGNNSNAGTILAPLLSVATAVGKASAGDTIYMRGGTYALTTTINISKSGSSATSRMQLWAYPGERPLLDFSGMAFSSSNRGISLSGSYWYIKGISEKGAGDNGLYISGANNIIEFCEFYENRDSGLQLSGGANNNKIINCDSYYNADPTDYGDADGFSVKMNVGTGNYFYGCRSWMNVDDGWDGYLRGANNVTTTLENCWTWRNGYFKDGTDAGANANGNGFKMGGSDTANLMHNFILHNCLSFNNKAKGFDQNNNKGSMTLYNCTGYNNVGKDFSISSALNSGQVCTITNCVDLGTSKVSLGSFVIQTTNSWQSPFVVTSADFLSIDSTGVTAPRQADGSLPIISYMHLATGSDLIDAGTNVGIAYNNTKPDLGAWETGNYTITTSVNGYGYILLNPVGGIYTPGTQVSITAKPSTGNSFIDWTGSITGALTTTTVTINADMNITANFQVLSGVADLGNRKDNVMICNPSVVSDLTTLTFYLSKPEPIDIFVYNVSGQKVIDFGYANCFTGGNNRVISLSSLKPGVYIVVAGSNTSWKQCKILKE
jgi:hypothetical protein